MPKVMKTGGINVLDNAVKIRDLAQSHLAYKKQSKPKKDAEENPQDAFMAEEFSDDEGTPKQEDMIATDDLEKDYAEEKVSAGLKEEILQAAMAESGRIIEDAVRKAEEIQNQKLQEGQNEIENLRLKAAEEGRKEGAETVVKEVKDIAEKLENGIAGFEAERAGFEAEYEQQLKWLAIEIAEKVLAKKIDQNDAEVFEMVEKAVQGLKNESWIRLEVSKEMTVLIDKLTDFFATWEQVEVSAVPTEKGEVQIETPSGIVDVSLKTQIANLKQYFTTT